MSRELVWPYGPLGEYGPLDGHGDTYRAVSGGDRHIQNVMNYAAAHAHGPALSPGGQGHSLPVHQPATPTATFQAPTGQSAHSGVGIHGASDLPHLNSSFPFTSPLISGPTQPHSLPGHNPYHDPPNTAGQRGNSHLASAYCSRSRLSCGDSPHDDYYTLARSQQSSYGNHLPQYQPRTPYSLSNSQLDMQRQPQQPQQPQQHQHAASILPPISASYASRSTPVAGLSSPSLCTGNLRHSHPPKRIQQPQWDGKAAIETTTAAASPNTTALPPPHHIDLPYASPIASGIRLVSPREALPDRIRAIFPYELFNAVQSKCFSLVYQSNDNVVISAPTGSGKTAILELAICRLHLERRDQNFKVVYQAPTKALCSERFRDWEKKFAHLGLKCAELTGDSTSEQIYNVGKANIIITTPEKWDSITRKWADHRRLLELVELFLIDEVHILKDIRGATLEAVVCRMKTIGSNVRFIALSATVPNSEDIAKWLGCDHTNSHLPARRETFGEELRPVKLQKFVYGEHFPGNDFCLEKALDDRLPTVLAKHTRNKPILIFCFTRASCVATAKRLGEMWAKTPVQGRLWPPPRKAIRVKDEALQAMMCHGVAFHHAQMQPSDRLVVEKAYLAGEIHVICCTSTLAVGVNLPCHTVVLKGTVGFQGGKLKEYCDLEVMQMLGRAGRPQFDNSAVAIILTRAERRAKYSEMVSGKELLESTLHLNLIEHINSEIDLRTIRSLPSAKVWLNGTFFRIRLQRNPSHYHVDGPASDSQNPDEMLEELCERNVTQLQDEGLVTKMEPFECTKYGKAMSKYMVRFETMKLITRLPKGVDTQELLNTLCGADEFREARLKHGEKGFYRAINDSPFIRFKVKEGLSQTWQKVSIIIQAELGGLEPGGAENPYSPAKQQYLRDKRLVFDCFKRLLRCAIDCKGADCDGAGTRNALELFRSVSGGGWEDMPSQLLQVAGVGPANMRRLVQHDIKSINQLAKTASADIERFLSRNPPFGKKLLDAARKFPTLSLQVSLVEMSNQRYREHHPTAVSLKAKLGYQGEALLSVGNIKKTMSLTFMAETSDGRLVYFWRGTAKKMAKAGDSLELHFSADMSSIHDMIWCQFSCEELVGTKVTKGVTHHLPTSAFAQLTVPSPSSQPPSPVVVESNGTQHFPFDIDDDSIDDEDLLNAAAMAEAGLSSYPQVPEPEDPESADLRPEEAIDDDVDEDEFPPVENLIAYARCSIKATNPKDAIDEDGDTVLRQESVRLPNGKWTCSHLCANGGLTKKGKPCKHTCCRDGVEKRPRPRGVKREADADGTPEPTHGCQAPMLQDSSSHADKKRKILSSEDPNSAVPIHDIGQERQHGQSSADSQGLKPFDIRKAEIIDLSREDDDEQTPFRNGPVPVDTGASKYTVMSLGTQCEENNEKEPGVGEEPWVRSEAAAENQKNSTFIDASLEKTGGRDGFRYEDDNADDDDDIVSAIPDPLAYHSAEPSPYLTANGQDHARRAFRPGVAPDVIFYARSAAELDPEGNHDLKKDSCYQVMSQEHKEAVHRDSVLPELPCRCGSFRIGEGMFEDEGDEAGVGSVMGVIEGLHDEPSSAILCTQSAAEFGFTDAE